MDSIICEVTLKQYLKIFLGQMIGTEFGPQVRSVYLYSIYISVYNFTSDTFLLPKLTCYTQGFLKFLDNWWMWGLE